MNYPKDRTITIRKKRYKLRHVPLPQNGHQRFFGETDPPRMPNKEIRIHNKLTEYELLGTYLHEFTHGGLDDLDESVVEEFSNDLTRILWALGYRRVAQ